MSQNPVDNVLVLNTGDDLYRSTAMTVNLDIDIEDALESLGSGHSLIRSDFPLFERSEVNLSAPLPAQVIQNSIDGLLNLDAGDNLHGTPAIAINL